MTITTGTNGNKVKFIEVTSQSWLEVPRVTSSTLVIQNQGYVEVYWLISTVMPQSLEEPCFMLAPRSIERTISDFESTAHKVFVRAHTSSARVAFQAG
jgi:hypothetical protein